MLAQPPFRLHVKAPGVLVALSMLIALLLAACGPAATPTPEPTLARPLRPTFTPTPVSTDTPTAIPPTPTPEATPTPAPTDTPETEPPSPTPEPATPTPEPAPVAIVGGTGRVNVRSGPGTNYAVRGQVSSGTSLAIVARNEAGDWWQVCCVNDQEAWIVARLVNVQGDPGSVQVAANIPAPPPPTPRPTARPAAPTNTPAPAQPTAPPDPGCGTCQFTLDGSPEFFPDSNDHLKLYMRVWHRSRNEAQGDYVLHIERNGQDLTRSDLKSQIGGFQNTWPFEGGRQRKHNYSLEIPGDPTGTYTIWLINGNGDRATKNYQFTVPANSTEREVWISFGQG